MIKKHSLKLAMLLSLAMVSMIALSSCRSGVNGEIYIYCYGDYYDQEIIEEFEDETGIGVVQDSYDTAEELYTLLSNSNTSYDCICTSDYMIGKMIEEGMLSEIDFENVPAIKNIDPLIMEKSNEFDPGNKYSVPYQIGVAGIAYNKKMVGNTVIDSWDDLWNPKFKDQIVMPDSVRDAMMIGLMKNGYSLNTTNEAEIAKAAADLTEQKPLVYKYANDAARDLLADGSAAVGVIWNGEYQYTTDLNDDVEFIVPKEGTEFFIDSWAIPKNVANKEGAEAWLNFLCKKKVALTNFDYLYYTTPNLAAKNALDEDILNDESIFPTDETLKRCYSLKTLDSDTMAIYSKYWKKVKAK
ncbi:MAG: spermidine/putrescine ABC transporter substrate-binding protein [Clostridiales bacterium]|nr:spermidine/putrescine ABC transporter substrate-binding protein [Candidatus Crickella merdequi]